MNPDGSTTVKRYAQKYPNYYEDCIHFQPTYKRNFDDNQYKNKKS